MISLTVSLIAVFIPLLFMSGIVGRMFREFALTLTIAVVVSAVVSLTLTPMMCASCCGKADTRPQMPSRPISAMRSIARSSFIGKAWNGFCAVKR